VFSETKGGLIFSDVAIHKPHSKAKFVNCDARNLPFKDGTFNVVTCFHVIEHIEDSLTVLEEIHILKGGLASACYAERKKI
jgi:ubiquinone/menaquinone biosynthesis C-methylase UbiE